MTKFLMASTRGKNKMNSLGFVTDTDEADDKPKEMAHEYSETLKAHKWDAIVLGQRVQSVITRTTGNITRCVKDFSMYFIEISWANGNVSYAKHVDMDKVILIDQ